MFSSIFFFEMRRLLKSASTYIYFAILVVVTFLLALVAGGAFKDAVFKTTGGDCKPGHLEAKLRKTAR